MNLFDKEILITGGTGSLASVLIRKLKKHQPKGIRIYSRDEYKQWKLKNELINEGINNRTSFLIGDIRDRERLYRAMNRVNIVINCAAMKQVPACENDPFEAVKTNITGSQNIIDCAIDNKVGQVMHISTDKSVLPINLYGATKTVAEKLFINANNYTGGRVPIISCCRYGNVIGSRGSVVELFKKQAKEFNEVTITDKRMTRFWITLDQVSDFIIDRLQDMEGWEVFIPKMPSMNIMDLKEVIAPKAKVKTIGIRPGEKLHENLISHYETNHLIDRYNHYILDYTINNEATDFEYTSDKNEWQLTKEELKNLIKE